MVAGCGLAGVRCGPQWNGKPRNGVLVSGEKLRGKEARADSYQMGKANLRAGESWQN